MSKHKPDSLEADVRLGAMARQDAEQLTPLFCEMLHARVMRRVAEARAGGVQTARSPRSARFLTPLLATAAMIAIASALWVRAPHADNRPAPVATPTPRPTITVAVVTPKVDTHPIANVEQAVRTAVDEHRWAGLDRDIRQAGEYLVAQVPLRSAWEENSDR